MSAWRPFCETAHAAALAVWLAALVAGGVTASVAFPTMRELDPHLPPFAAYDGEHWPIAAGQIAERVFFITDVAQFAAAMMAILTVAPLLALGWIPRTRPATVVRIIALFLAVGALAGRLIIVAPSMNASVRAYWSAAVAGENEQAAAHRAAFNELHPIATNLMLLGFVCVAACLLASVWSAATHGDARAQLPPATRPGHTELEEPLLARKNR